MGWGCERQQHNKVYASPRSRGRRVTSCCLCGQASRPTTLNISIMLSCKSGLQVVDPQIGLKIFCSDFQLPNGMIDCQHLTSWDRLWYLPIHCSKLILAEVRIIKRTLNRSIQNLGLSQSTISIREVLTLFWCLEHQICSQLFPKWEVQVVNWPVEKWRWGAWTSCEIYTFLSYLWKTGPLGMRGLRAPSFQEMKFEANLGNRFAH